MSSRRLIANERQAKEGELELAELEVALSSEQTLKAIVSGLPQEVMGGIRRSLKTERRELAEALKDYDMAKFGDLEPLKQRAGNDPGSMLIVARIVKRLTQKELARKLGMAEQQIQRYEAERYKSVSLHRYQKIATLLDLRLSIDIRQNDERWLFAQSAPNNDELTKVLRHAHANGWLDEDEPDEKAGGQLKRYVADHVLRHGTPSLLRTGLNVIDHTQDWVLLSWKAQVTRVAERIIEKSKPVYRPANVSWLAALVRLSLLDDGPILARDMLLEHGIVLVVEPQITGMNVDGAAFLIDAVPVIGLTILRDSIDNFWFTMLHELAHIVLHYRTGLAAGFFDDLSLQGMESVEDIIEMEHEANDFAGNLLIPSETWKRSPARIAKTAEPIEKLAQQLKIHPAIVFGRIRMERKDFSLFSNKIGRGAIRAKLSPKKVEA